MCIGAVSGKAVVEFCFWSFVEKTCFNKLGLIKMNCEKLESKNQLRRIKNWTYKFSCVALILLVGLAVIPASAQVGNCPSRPASGSVVNNPLDLFSNNGALTLELDLNNGVDSAGYTHDCFNYNNSGATVEAPTLRVNPSDILTLTLVNDLNLPATRRTTPMHMGPMKMPHTKPDTSCNGGTITQNTTNLHFHGLNIPPVCHQDDVVNTLIQPTDPPFQYRTQIPANEPPGLYWYHPHPHGYTTNQVNGGASGAIIVSGIENIKPQTAGLTEEVLLLRQQFLNPGSWLPGPYEMTLNFQTIVTRPLNTYPVIIQDPGEKQFYRVLNASTQAFLTLQVWYDGTPQTVELISIDAVPVSNDPFITTITLPPAGRAEFIVTGPAEGTNAQLVNLGFDTGPVGNPNPSQPFADIISSSDASKRHLRVPTRYRIPAAKPQSKVLRFAGVENVKPTTTRSLYFSEATQGTNGPTN